MKFETIQKGMYVKALKKSINPESFREFLSYHRDAICPVTGKHSNGKEQFVVLDCWNFHPEDVEIVKCPSKFKEGMKVKAIRKTIMPESWNSFLQQHPDQIITVHFQQNDGAVMVKGGFAFASDDLVIMEEKMSESRIGRKKAITIRALAQDGACTDKLCEFITIVMKKDVRYAWEEIPPVLAQDVAKQLGYPEWLIDHEFISIKKDIVTDVKVTKDDLSYIVSVETNDGSYSVFRIHKDGSGFTKFWNISKDSGLKLTLDQELEERKRC